MERLLLVVNFLYFISQDEYLNRNWIKIGNNKKWKSFSLLLLLLLLAESDQTKPILRIVWQLFTLINIS